MCANCVPWRDEILANHRLEEAPVHWNNCIPHLWPYEKWEVAKVYMPGGQRIKCSFDKFDITALLNLMANCNHFRAFVETQKLLQVNEVRNIATHAPDMTVSEEDLKKYLVKIKDLGRALEPHAPRLRRLSTETDRLRKMLDSPEQESGVRCFAASFDVMSEWDAERFSLTERTEFLLQCYQEEQLDGLKEAVQGTVKYLEHSEKLKAILGRELSKLHWIQKQRERLEQDTKYQ
ncbi:uncharacterized protein CXorf38-like [Chanos chanos]|uniref:Uncharacterized protein CXorf38-like n=1 Tax=Chanos chanos TaxID=29144 RepID=A0A6J2VSI4_CHACN|nr:uncharacterized protein CXorf38-like [Chanos chanos]